MSEISYTELDEDIARLAEIVKVSETNTTLIQLIKGQISLEKAISKIYLENMESPPSTKMKYKGQMVKLR